MATGFSLMAWRPRTAGGMDVLVVVVRGCRFRVGDLIYLFGGG